MIFHDDTRLEVENFSPFYIILILYFFQCKEDNLHLQSMFGWVAWGAILVVIKGLLHALDAYANSKASGSGEIDTKEIKSKKNEYWQKWCGIKCRS